MQNWILCREKLVFRLLLGESLNTVYVCVLLKGVQFSADGKFLALAERRDCKDFISLFDCNSWQLIKVGGYYFVCILSSFLVVTA